MQLGQISYASRWETSKSYLLSHLNSTCLPNLVAQLNLLPGLLASSLI